MPSLAGWATRLPRSTVLLAAFAVGLTVATAVYVLNGRPGAGIGRSVVVDRDPGSVRARALHRAFGNASGEAAAASSADAAARTPSRGLDAPTAMPTAVSVSAPPGMAVRRGPQSERIASVTPRAPVAYDRVLGLADALDGCGLESPFARLACEQRARARYCEGASGRVPQCADARSRDHGQ